ncbi:hypothetical protein [Saccharopolyspora oryzae]|uniref:Uncharacterized protein n=1 Tax=Saccharopolyspora oryzae TaxID=2997343 RepID=A0ABT4VB18_9PSEU|nr:hypothetical protein [Saccharopolyspora oryzae]MDA3631150.1 hypothetical protein [Saccharopolyspora oryzae]
MTLSDPLTTQQRFDSFDADRDELLLPAQDRTELDELDESHLIRGYD